MASLILGSQSPRRKEILSYFDLQIKQVSPIFDEEAHPFQGDPRIYVQELALGKSQSLVERFPETMILTADTTVYCEGKIYNKPKNAEEAFQMIASLSGKWHSVLTGVSLRLGLKEQVSCEETLVLFNPITSEQIRHYHSRIHWADKAGGYAIQSAGGLIVNRIDGCYYNVLGLPINTVRHLMHQFNIELWDYLKE